MNDLFRRLRNYKHLPYVLIAVLLSFIFWNLWSLVDYPLVEPQNSEVSSQAMPAKSKMLLSNDLLQQPLFGVYVPDEGGTNIKSSSLDIKIVGVVVAEQPSDSHVLIEMSDGKQKIFSTGDELPGDAQIKKITNDGLLIWYNNQLERITFPNNELDFKPQFTPLEQETY